MARRSRGVGSLAGLASTVRSFTSVLRGVDRLNVNSNSGGRARPSEGYFDEGLWQENSQMVIQQQLEISDTNAGQLAILEGDFADAAAEVCQQLGEDYNEDGFVNNVRAAIGDEKFNAISEIIEKCSEELNEAWDASYGGDGMGAKLFGRLAGPGTIMWTQIGGSIRAQGRRDKKRIERANFVRGGGSFR